MSEVPAWSRLCKSARTPWQLLHKWLCGQCSESFCSAVVRVHAHVCNQQVTTIPNHSFIFRSLVLYRVGANGCQHGRKPVNIRIFGTAYCDRRYILLRCKKFLRSRQYRIPMLFYQKSVHGTRESRLWNITYGIPLWKQFQSTFINLHVRQVFLYEPFQWKYSGKKTISVIESQFRKGLKSAPTFWFYHFAGRVFEGE